MFALVESGNITQTPKGNKGITLNGNQYPASIYTLWTEAERNAINAPIQGSAADIIKLAMIEVDREIVKRNMKSRMLIQVHDELVFDMFLKEKGELKLLVKNKMEQAVSLQVPLIVDMGEGLNWLKAH